MRTHEHLSLAAILLFSLAFPCCSTKQQHATRAGSRVFYSDTIVYRGERTVANCLFEIGSNIDCKILDFSCGDFGQAMVDLSREELALWDSMIVLTDDGLYGRQDYYDGLFELTYEKTKGTTCKGDAKTDVVVPKVIGFRLISLRDSITGYVDTTFVELTH